MGRVFTIHKTISVSLPAERTLKSYISYHFELVMSDCLQTYWFTMLAYLKKLQFISFYF